MTWHRPRALTFDCYGTLIDWETGLLRDLRAGLDLRHRASDEDLLTWYALAEPAAESGPFRIYKDVLRDAQAGVARLAGAAVRDSEALVRGLPTWPPFPDTPGALRRLKQLAEKQHCRLCVVSNVDRDLFSETEKLLGIAFDEVVTADQIQSYKPRPAHFKEALRRMALNSNEVLHVAQSLYHDHAPAKALGMRTVWIDRRASRTGGATPLASNDVEPDFRFTTLAEFADWAEGNI